MIRRILRDLRRRIDGMVARAVVRAVTDTASAQGLQLSVYHGELQDDLTERFQEYGFTSHPPAGTEAIVLAVGGHRTHAVVVATESREYRVTATETGDVVLYDSRSPQQKIHLRPQQGDILIVGGTVRLNDEGATAPGVARDGDDVSVPIDPTHNTAWDTWFAQVATGAGVGPHPTTPLVGSISEGSSSVTCGG